MEIYHDLNDFTTLPSSVVSIGVFDGVHLGHRQIFQKQRAIAQKQGLKSVIFTFAQNPIEVLKPDLAPNPVVDLDTKINLLAQQKPDFLIIQNFDQNLANLTAEQFIEQILLAKLRAQVVVVGANFRFGQAQQGNTKLLQSFRQKQGLQTIELQPLASQGDTVSSTRIRQLLQTGKIDQASQLLGWDYRQFLKPKSTES
jgi:riboflavin kinase / FMN adenylyltransferase